MNRRRKDLKIMMKFEFPKGFMLGTGSSAFQIEGAVSADGKGEITWDYMSRVYPESFYNNAKTEPGAWFYKNYKEDIKAMGELGLKSFRMSISWARIIPDGIGEINQKGIDYYNEVIDLLIENGIEPFVDLYHWDTPQHIEELGGMKNRKFIDWFENYARVCFQNFGDRVKIWSTFNEPGVFCFNKYSNGSWFPFEHDEKAGYLAAHNTILAHYRAVKAYREMKLGGKIGAVVDLAAIYPLDPAGNDTLAAKYQVERMGGWWLDPFFRARYPETILKDCPELGKLMPENYAEELKENFEPIDMIGINYYYPAIVNYQEDLMLKSTNAPSYYVQEGQMFNLYPAGIYDVMMYLTREYDIPEIYITENGLGQVTKNDKELDVNDDERISYLREHLRMVVRAINAGAKIKGYYYWSHFDSLESRAGYRWKFGLVRVDLETGERTKKKSWYYYQKLIKDNAVD